MNTLTTRPNIASPDDFYERLIQSHAGLSTEQSHAMNAALVLLLSNHIGDSTVLDQALQHARDSVVAPAGTDATPG